MVERYRPPADLPVTPPAAKAKVARYRPKVTSEMVAATAPGRSEIVGPFQVGDYIEVNLTDAPPGSGYRFYLVLHVYPRKKEVRLFHAPNLQAFDYDREALARNKTLRRLDARYVSRLAKRIRERKREYKTFGMRVTGDTDAALALLRS